MAREHRSTTVTAENGSSTRASGSLDEQSAPKLLARLIEDVTALFRNELALARAELVEAGHRAKGGVGAVAAGGGVLLAGALTLVAALVLALAEFVEPWLAALIVGAVLAAIGYAMLAAGKKRLEPSAFSLERTQQSLRKDKATVAGTVERSHS